MFDPKSFAKCRTLKLRLHVDAQSGQLGWQGTVTVHANSRKPETVFCPAICSSRDAAILQAGDLERQIRRQIYAAR